MSQCCNMHLGPDLLFSFSETRTLIALKIPRLHCLPRLPRPPLPARCLLRLARSSDLFVLNENFVLQVLSTLRTGTTVTWRHGWTTCLNTNGQTLCGVYTHTHTSCGRAHSHARAIPARGVPPSRLPRHSFLTNYQWLKRRSKNTFSWHNQQPTSFYVFWIAKTLLCFKESVSEWPNAHQWVHRVHLCLAEYNE